MEKFDLSSYNLVKHIHIIYVQGHKYCYEKPQSVTKSQKVSEIAMKTYKGAWSGMNVSDALVF